MKKIVLILFLVLFISTTVRSAVFEDDFESEALEAFPSQWQHFTPGNSDVEVIDDSMYPGGVYEGDQALRIQFNGGSGSGIQTTFSPVTEGILTFYCSIDWASDDLQLMGLYNSSDTQALGSQLMVVSAVPVNNEWEYHMGGVSSGLPVFFDE